MSFLFYNPLEAMVLVLPLWILNRNKINWENKKLIFGTFIRDCFIVGFLNLIIQLPLNLLLDSLFYIFYNTVVCLGGMIIILYFYNKFRFKVKNLFLSFGILFGYYVTLIIVLNNSSSYLEFIKNQNKFTNELFTNLYARFVQIIVLIFIFGGNIMLKKMLKKNAEKNLKKAVASTAFAIGEPKLSEKLKKSIKESK